MPAMELSIKNMWKDNGLFHNFKGFFYWPWLSSRDPTFFDRPSPMSPQNIVLFHLP